jgi:hypothetical protein
MSNITLALIIAFVIIVLAIACLAIGWLIKGKSKVDARPRKKEEPNEDEPIS